MIILFDRDTVEKSLSMRSLVAKKHLDAELKLTKGLARIQLYIQEKKADGSGMPIFRPPINDILKGLFAVLVDCQIKESYRCEKCIFCNFCLRKLVWKLTNLVFRTKKQRIDLAQVLLEPDVQTQKEYNEYTSTLLLEFKKYVYAIGQQSEN